MAAILHPRPEISSRPQPPPRPELRIIHGGRSTSGRATYRRRRLGVALLAIVLAFGGVAVGRGALASLAPAAPAVSGTPASGGSVVVVRAGDTLWSIARRLHPSGDVRGLVDRLAAAHGPGPLLVGDRLPVGS